MTGLGEELARLPLYDCADLPAWIQGVDLVSRSTTQVMRGLTVCELDAGA